MFFFNQITFSMNIVLPVCGLVLTVVYLSITVGAMLTHFIPLCFFFQYCVASLPLHVKGPFKTFFSLILLVMMMVFR